MTNEPEGIGHDHLEKMRRAGAFNTPCGQCGSSEHCKADCPELAGCSWFTGGFGENPPEYCDESAVPGGEYCAIHQAKVDAMEEHTP
jgi:CO dehydrogenase/acetyl-CoA synthase beta subunit